MTDIHIRNVSKIFGGNWKAALAMAQQGFLLKRRELIRVR